MHGYAASARWCASALAGDSGQSRALRSAAEAWMTRESIRNPNRMAAMLAFDPSLGAGAMPAAR
jgi:hypothetical protein